MRETQVRAPANYRRAPASSRNLLRGNFVRWKADETPRQPATVTNQPRPAAVFVGPVVAVDEGAILEAEDGCVEGRETVNHCCWKTGARKQRREITQ